MEKILSLSGPTLDLAPSVVTERKFQNKCRLYIGNVSSEITEEELLELFKPFGESTELFLNKEKNFSFIRMVRSGTLRHVLQNLIPLNQLQGCALTCSSGN